MRASLLLVPLLLASCVVRLAPPPTPGPAVPPRSAAPIADGFGRAYLEVLDGPTDIYTLEVRTLRMAVGRERISARMLAGGRLCTTPCVVDLPLGTHTLAFPVRGGHNLDLVDIDVGDRPFLYRRVLARRSSGGAGEALGVLGVTFGGLSLATGATLLPIGLATEHDGMSLAGGVTLAAGAALLVAGIYALAANPAHEQPGVGASYPLPTAP